MEWGFIWLMFALKIPIFMLLWIVWWAVRQSDEPAQDSGDGGAGRRQPPHPRPPRRRPRGPHGEPAPLPGPQRVRSIKARGRSVHRSG